MSSNLYVTFDGIAFDLYQTPTHITHMCLTNDDCLTGNATGKKARAAITRYVLWARAKPNSNEHVEQVILALKGAKRVKAYLL